MTAVAEQLKTMYFVDRGEFTITPVTYTQGPQTGIGMRDSLGNIILSGSHFDSKEEAESYLAALAVDYIRSVRKEQEKIRERLLDLESYTIKPRKFLESLNLNEPE